MTVLGIDPGPKESAYVVWDGSKVIEAGKIPSANILDLEPDAKGWELVAIECCTGYGMQVGQETFETIRWEGKYEYVFEHLVNTRRVSRKEVKRLLCENATANDKFVRQALIDRIGPQGTKRAPGPLFGITDDKLAALAVAVYAWDMEGRK